MKFLCMKCGNCCRENVIPLTWNDIIRIKDYNPEKEVYHFVEFIAPDNLSLNWAFAPWIQIDGKEFTTILKRINETGVCIFLREDNTCDIYDARPRACRMFPFLGKDIHPLAYDICQGLDKGNEMKDIDLKWEERAMNFEQNKYDEFIRDWYSFILENDDSMKNFLKFVGEYKSKTKDDF